MLYGPSDFVKKKKLNMQALTVKTWLIFNVRWENFLNHNKKNLKIFTYSSLSNNPSYAPPY